MSTKDPQDLLHPWPAEVLGLFAASKNLNLTDFNGPSWRLMEGQADYYTLMVFSHFSDAQNAEALYRIRHHKLTDTLPVKFISVHQLPDYQAWTGAVWFDPAVVVRLMNEYHQLYQSTLQKLGEVRAAMHVLKNI